MPLLYIDLIEGRTPSEVKTLLGAIHDAVVDAFEVPPRDRYQGRPHPSGPRDRGLGYRSWHRPLTSTGSCARGEPATERCDEGKVL